MVSVGSDIDGEVAMLLIVAPESRDQKRQLRYARNKMRKIKLAVGSDGRNRTVLWPFKAKTSRTQPKAAKWIFSPAVWLRSLIKPEPGMAVAYIDYSSMEFMIAAVRSDGHCGPSNPMLDDYNSGDPYLSFAKRVGAVPRNATKKSHADRDVTRWWCWRRSTGCGRNASRPRRRLDARGARDAPTAPRGVRTVLAMVRRLAPALPPDRHHAHGDGLDLPHRRPRAQRALDLQLADPVGRRRHLRIACIMATRRGIKLLAPVHDAVLIEAPIERIEADVALMREIMRRASRIVLNATADGQHELRTDVKIVAYPQRYSDKRGAEIWHRVLAVAGGGAGARAPA